MNFHTISRSYRLTWNSSPILQQRFLGSLLFTFNRFSVASNIIRAFRNENLIIKEILLNLLPIFTTKTRIAKSSLSMVSTQCLIACTSFIKGSWISLSCLVLRVCVMSWDIIVSPSNICIPRFLQAKICPICAALQKHIVRGRKYFPFHIHLIELRVSLKIRKHVWFILNELFSLLIFVSIYRYHTLYQLLLPIDCLGIIWSACRKTTLQHTPKK